MFDFPEKLVPVLFTPARYKVAYGGRSCVHGKTKISTPHGDIAIEDFRGGMIYSMGERGIEEVAAGAPVRCSPEMLFNVVVESGQEIVCTAGHKFMTPCGWSELRQLSAGCLVSLPAGLPIYPSGLSCGASPSGSLEDAHRCLRIILGFLYYYSKGSRPYGAQPHSHPETYLDVLRVLADGKQHIPHALMHGGERVNAYMRDYQLSLPLLSSSAVLLAGEVRNYEEQGNCSDGKSSGLLLALARCSRLSRENIDPAEIIQELSKQLWVCGSHAGLGKIHQIISGTLRFGVDDKTYSSSLIDICNHNHITTSSAIMSIEKYGTDEFYDIFVPFYNNYIGNGFINHNSSKSWSFIRALLLKGISTKLRIMCAREFQRSIKDSVHKLLSDQIVQLGIESKYQVLDQEIRGSNGSEFIFVGLSDQTVDTIKSYEGIDICFIEEGQTISERSWKILMPTIRKDGSEIWVVFNPDLESDPTYQRFVANPAPDSIVVKMNWRDNPFFNEVMEAERQDCLKRFPNDYPNVWEGECRPAVEGAIFFSEVAQMEREGRICNVPHDPMLKSHIVFDLGFNDEMSVAIIQKHSSEIRIIKYIEDTQRTLASYSAELKELKYNWGKVWLPFSDGFSKDFKTGHGANQVLRALGWNVAKKEEVSQSDVEEGIRQCRLVFPRFYVDQNNCGQLVECWKRYRRHINKQTMTAGAPRHDAYSHGGDCTRYIATNIDQMTNDIGEKRPMPRVISYGVQDAGVGY